ncbi:type I-G CRISPR-associated RAMP protein Csb1/Cas7g [Mangrovihabitans endophyticus]|uniref:type I-G CRISPR-associated RAMP protein Csb1/Cas7g n=1 Tax=Mangrovihabitans endophyticus TaxID=1751298 RepID=UPI00227A9217|nr:type I-U CRISPR-associated RAMP protein Csb1/Cas7u [Mangrovihabitans endophyticus]
MGLEGPRAVLRVRTIYQPAGGEGAKVFPPTYPVPDSARRAAREPGRAEDAVTAEGLSQTARTRTVPYVIEVRSVNGVKRWAALLDSVPSQANRAEEALLAVSRRGKAPVPLLELEVPGEGTETLTSLEFPHRYADAYLRDSLLDGTPFDKSQLGRSMLASTLDDARALYTNDPGSLVFGAWNSHRKGRQQKFPRVYASEVVGWDPVVGARNAGRMDPMNLQGAVKKTGDGDWEFTASGEKKQGSKLSEIGHGNIAPNEQHGGVTISGAERIATLSLAGLDRIGFGAVEEQAAVAARAVLAAYAIMADRLAFGGASLWLRSGCELVVQSERLEWVHRGGDTEPFDLTRAQAIDLFATAVDRAAKLGLGLSAKPVRLTPKPSLAEAITFSLTKAAPAAEGA